jgi:apolipoprotein N-acyltransferase
LIAVPITSVLLVLALPPVGWWPLAWFALMPAIWASRGRGFLVGFLVGISASLLLGWAAVEGFFYAAKSFEGERTWTYLGTAIFGFVLSICCGLVGEIKQLNPRTIVGLGCFVVLLDLALMPLLPVTFAISQARVPGMLTLSSLTGIWGVSFLLWTVNLSLVALAETGRAEAGRAEVKPVNLRGLAVLPAIAAIFLLVGLLPSRQREGLRIRVAVVQSPSTELPEMVRLSRKDSPQMAVWPEFSGLAHVRQGDATSLIQLAEDPAMPTFVTSFPDANQPLPHNTAALFSAEGESARYFKRRLFGGEVRMHTPGDGPVAAKTQWGPVGLNICFDSCFPNLMRDSSRQGNVGFIALPTIDPPSPHGFIAAMHSAFTPFRAAELGVAVARADGYSHSMIVGNTGVVLAELPPNVEDSISALVDFTPRWTLYKAVGDWFLVACGLALLWLCSTNLWSRRNSEGRSSIL